MNPQYQQPYQYPQNQAQLNAEASTVGRFIGTFFLIGPLIFSIILTLVGMGITATANSHKTYTGSAQATVQHVSEQTSTTNNNSYCTGSRYSTNCNNQSTTTTCTTDYSFIVAGKTYNGSSSDCNYTKGDSIPIYYSPSNPAKNATDQGGNKAIGEGIAVAGGVIFLIMITLIIKINVGKGKRSATSAQMELINGGFQELGEYWQPHHMSQTEAEQTIADINQRLAAQRRSYPAPVQTAPAAPTAQPTAMPMPIPVAPIMPAPTAQPVQPQTNPQPATPGTNPPPQA